VKTNKKISIALYLLVFFNVISFESAAQEATTSTVAVSPAYTLTKDDFSIQYGSEPLSLGQAWDSELINKLGKSKNDDFVGDVLFDNNSYKFYRHSYNGIELYSSNLWWDKASRDVDSYIVAQISIESDKYQTKRKVTVGTDVNLLTSIYGPGDIDNTDGDKWIIYSMGNKTLSFNIKNDKVAMITMVYSNGN